MIRLKLYGLGGQGIVTASKILTHAVAISEGRYAKNLPAYRHERRGAPIFADVMIADDEILLNSFVYDPDLVVVFDPSVCRKGTDIARGTTPQSVLLVNCNAGPVLQDLKTMQTWKEIYRVDASRIARQTLGRDIPNSAMLGALARTGIVKIDSLECSLMEHFGEKAGEINSRAARMAFEQVRTADETDYADFADGKNSGKIGNNL
jgi:2-oxoacid:acceptor oxidoreductase gamma subunit (pyruvate/2-ketoisovalerate family)